MKKKEVKEIIFMPNEIFKEFQNELGIGTNIAFAYSYYYYVSYLYRYCKFVADKKITQKEIKQKLGYSPVNKKIDYIIKKDGTLDNLGYTQTTTDYPVKWELGEYNEPIFTTINEHKKNYETFRTSDSHTIISDRNYKVKCPLRAFYRDNQSFQEKSVDGTFYIFDNTHGIAYDVFNYFMENKDLGVVAFYIYGYLKYKSITCGGKYQASLVQLENELIISVSTIQRYIAKLEQDRYVKIDHKEYIHDQPQEANVYKTF